jgi:phage-related protein
MLDALHAFIKKTQKTPPGELVIARQRMTEIQSWPARTRT